MDPVTAISTATTSIRTATEIVRLLIGADASLKKAELKLKLAGLSEALANAKTQIDEVKQTLAAKDETIARLQEALDTKGRIVLKDSAYWLTDAQGNLVGGPFCTNCYEGEKVKRTLVPEKDEPQVKCPNCRMVFCSKAVFRYLRPDLEEELRQYQEMVKKCRAERRF